MAYRSSGGKGRKASVLGVFAVLGTSLGTASSDSFVSTAWADPPAAANARAPAKVAVDQQRIDAANALLSEETLGGIRLGMTRGEVIALLGEPSRKSKTEKEGKSGSADRWFWKGLNLGILFVSDDAKTPGIVRGIAVYGVSSLKTAKNIGVGSKLRDVDAAYSAGHVAAPPPSSMYIVGGEGGMAFDVGMDGTVAAMYWGRELGS